MEQTNKSYFSSEIASTASFFFTEAELIGYNLSYLGIESEHTLLLFEYPAYSMLLPLGLL